MIKLCRPGKNWKTPEFDFSERTDRVTLKLEVGQVVYIPGAADLRNENTIEPEQTERFSKEEKVLAYMRRNGSISTQVVADICKYKTRAGARKLLEKMLESGLIRKVGSGPATKYEVMDTE